MAAGPCGENQFQFQIQIWIRIWMRFRFRSSASTTRISAHFALCQSVRPTRVNYKWFVMVIHIYMYILAHTSIDLWPLPLWGFLFQLSLYRLVSHLGATYLSCQQLINTFIAQACARYVTPRAAELVCYRISICGLVLSRNVWFDFFLNNFQPALCMNAQISAYISARATKFMGQFWYVL